MPKSEKGDNSAKYLQNVCKMLIRSSRPYLYVKYHDPSSNGSPDILFTRFHRFTMQKSKKGHNSAMTSPTEKKKILVAYFFMLIPQIKFQDPISNRS